MSGIAIFRGPHGITVLTDGANWEFDEEVEQYKVTCFHSKVVMLPHINAVLASQGTGDFLPSLHYNGDASWTSFDALAEQIAEDVEANLRHMERCYPLRRFAVIITLAGWSDSRERYESYSVIVDADGSVSARNSLNEFSYIPIPDNASLRAVGLLGEQEDHLGNLHGFNAMYLFMQAQRLTKTPMGSRENPPEGHCLGGFIQETTLTRNKIETRIVHRWPDVVGEPIIPKDGEVDEIRRAFPMDGRNQQEGGGGDTK